MLMIRFYNLQNKYTDQIGPFQNSEISQMMQKARRFSKQHSNIRGWTVYEQVGGCWFPYRPFNRCIRYDLQENLSIS
ncbi:hypothetical protein A7X67_02995 [Clostridium sp. W14A]|nr:hypothetical protein A7X67_02995 [Clostridium sp. W14A]